MELLVYLSVIRKRFWIFLLFVSFACVGTGLYTHYMIPALYKASAQLIVNQHPNGDGTEALTFNEVNMNIRLIATYKELIRTSAILDRVVEAHPELGLTASALIQKIDVSSVNDTQVMTVSVTDPSYERAAVLANTVSHVFREQVPDIMHVDNVKILSLANVSATPDPISPDVVMNVLLSFVAAAVVALGLIFLLEYVDDSLKTEQDVVRQLGLPTVAVISQINKRDWRPLRSDSSPRKKAGDQQYAAANQ